MRWSIELRLSYGFRRNWTITRRLWIDFRERGVKARGLHPDQILRGGDGTGGNKTAALSLRLKADGKKSLNAQILLYPEARLPFECL